MSLPSPRTSASRFLRPARACALAPSCVLEASSAIRASTWDTEDLKIVIDGIGKSSAELAKHPEDNNCSKTHSNHGMKCAKVSTSKNTPGTQLLHHGSCTSYFNADLRDFVERRDAPLYAIRFQQIDCLFDCSIFHLFYGALNY